MAVPLLVIPEAGKRTALAVLGVLGNAWALRSCARISSGSEGAAACRALGFSSWPRRWLSCVRLATSNSESREKDGRGRPGCVSCAGGRYRLRGSRPNRRELPIIFIISLFFLSVRFPRFVDGTPLRASQQTDYCQIIVMILVLFTGTGRSGKSK